ncbi:MAG: electron transfer flavoprotein subunit alpha/FixB family protein [Candidatus Abyssobacteria bacterium SURF_5]|uniref:Electron transfer flavoprotein subunit alpha/FixB family protein n=1 Tax=Abyssobacteria bacterium (strain SURF_5) TaxID=2093360 RepID=A0A3A4N933_ABYX5|nr:MAG: electron transfer flavoprotein subunit alpha/FixB family protein [Candidatus Abyssubacteria bacterium SURF_5]
MSEKGGIWLLGEFDARRRISGPTLHLFSRGESLAAASSHIMSAIFIGSEIAAQIRSCERRLPQRTYICEDSTYAEYEPELYTQALVNVCEEYQPDVFLAAHTTCGQELLSRLAARLGEQIVTDCIELDFDPNTGSLLMTKPIYGGNAIAVFASNTSPRLATVRARTSLLEASPAEETELIFLDSPLPPDAPKVKRIGFRQERDERARLEDAEIIVSGGRGIGGGQGFQLLHELAEVVGGAVGASRPPCDMRWVSSGSQVGLTGRSVAPRAYFAVAISGMMQHITGMFESQHVIAINKDKDANIFKMADYGVVGDYKEVLPALAKKLKTIRNS